MYIQNACTRNAVDIQDHKGTAYFIRNLFQQTSDSLFFDIHHHYFTFVTLHPDSPQIVSYSMLMVWHRKILEKV